MRDEYVEAILQVAARDASIAGVLREICALDGAVRSGALELVRAHLAHARRRGRRARVRAGAVAATTSRGGSSSGSARRGERSTRLAPAVGVSLSSLVAGSSHSSSSGGASRTSA